MKHDPETHAHIGCEEYYDEKPEFTKAALDELNEEVSFDHNGFEEEVALLGI